MTSKNLILCALSIFCLGFGNKIFAENLTAEKIVKISSELEVLEIKNDNGDLLVKPSKNNETIIEIDGDPNNFDFIKKGNRLIVERHKEKHFWKLVTNSDNLPPINVIVYLASSVKNLCVNAGKGTFDISDCSFEKIILKTGSANVALKNIIGNVILKTGKFEGALENIKGDVSISSGSCKNSLKNVEGNIFFNSGSLATFLTNINGNVNINSGSCVINYTMNQKPNFPINFHLRTGSFKFTAFLSDSFSSFRNNLKCAKVEESFLSIVKNNADLILSGSTGAAKISIKKL